MVYAIYDDIAQRLSSFVFASKQTFARFRAIPLSVMVSVSALLTLYASKIVTLSLLLLFEHCAKPCIAFREVLSTSNIRVLHLYCVIVTALSHRTLHAMYGSRNNKICRNKENNNKKSTLSCYTGVLCSTLIIMQSIIVWSFGLNSHMMFIYWPGFKWFSTIL